MKSMYDPNLVSAAMRLMENEDFHLLMTEHIRNLQAYTMDATEPAEVLKSHNEHSAMTGFVDYVRLLGEKPLKDEQHG